MPATPNRGAPGRTRDTAVSHADLDKLYWRRSVGTDFLDFLASLLRLAVTPITVPSRIIFQTLTAPLTISLVLKLILLSFLLFASSIFSVLAVGAFFWSWSTGGPIEAEGWLFYGSKTHRLPHALLQLPRDGIQEDLRYDVQVEMELVRPNKWNEDIDNFMLSLQLLSAKDPDTAVISAAQPSLVPFPLSTSFFSPSAFPSQLLPPCIIPWPFRFACPSRLLGYDRQVSSKVKQRRFKAGFSGSSRARDIVPLKKDLIEGVMLNPSGASDKVIGSAFVSIGREDSFGDLVAADSYSREIKTTGWVVVRLIPRPSGVRWLLASHPLPPLLLLPPVSLTLSLSSSVFAFIVISIIRRPNSKARAKVSKKRSHQTIEGSKEKSTNKRADVQAAKKDKGPILHSRDGEKEREKARSDINKQKKTGEGPRTVSIVSAHHTSESGISGTEETVESREVSEEEEEEDGSSMMLTTEDESETS